MVKTRKPGNKKGNLGNDSSDSSSDDEGSEEVTELDENGIKIVTLAPKEKRCKLNLFVNFDKEEEVNKSCNFLEKQELKFKFFSELVG